MLTTTDRELEIKLDKALPDGYRVELRSNEANNDAFGPFVTGKVTFDFEALEQAFRNADYGRLLTEALFADPPVRALFDKCKFEAAASTLRLRLFIAAGAIELNALRWELLQDPENEKTLTSSERIRFSRFVLTGDRRPIKLRARFQLRALIAVASPTNLPVGMAPVRKEVEIPAARKALAGIETTVLGEDEPVTLQRLVAAIRKGVDIVYLVCHGSYIKDVARLYLQNEKGEFEFALGTDLAQSFSDLAQPPRLMVLASCESGGSDGVSAHSALAPLLADSGVPAIIAMQAKVSMRTVEIAMPVFFSELLKDGQIDRAMAAARGAISTQLDAWVPALYLRLKSGSLWYVPGFSGTGEADDISWDSICEAAVQLDLVPIIGPDLAEHILGTSLEFATALASGQKILLSPQERVDSAKIAQTIKTKANWVVLRQAAKSLALKRLKETAIRLHRSAGLPDLPDPSNLKERDDLLDFIVSQLFQDPDDPFRILTQLDIKVFVSGTMDEILQRFLKKAGKVPVELFTDWNNECVVNVETLVKAATQLCEEVEKAPGTPVTDVVDAWEESLGKTIPLSLQAAVDTVKERLKDNPNVEPLETIRSWRECIRLEPTETKKKPWSTNTPVLYYVYGKVSYESTWVITEDDFFDYLIRHSTFHLLPKLVGEKLVAGSLLFLGFSLDDWKFRILFRIIMAKGGSDLLKKYKHVGVQVDPEHYTPAEAAQLKPLLVKYFGAAANISIYWGSSSDFLKEFWDHMQVPFYKDRMQPLPPAPNIPPTGR